MIVRRRASSRAVGLRIIALIAAAVPACSGPHGTDYSPSGNPADVSPGGKLTVTWSPPTRNSDGTPLKDLTGYTLLYGTAPDTYSSAISIDDATATRYVVSGLPPGTYYFAVSAKNSAGRHSVLSAEASGKVN
jgi:hypothetical protein